MKRTLFFSLVVCLCASLRAVSPSGTLPVLYIQTENNAAITSKDDYINATYYLDNQGLSDYQSIGSKAEPLAMEIKGRGNYSWSGFDKKPYRIKFDQKQSLFGLHEAKSWVLLAEYLDPSCMHNYPAFSLGAESDALAFTPTAHHVNLYLNGEFMGLYLLCEQVQENEGRMNLEQTITPDMTDLDQFNFYVCLDEYAPEQPGAKEGETYFYVPWCDNYYTLKYPQKADFTFLIPTLSKLTAKASPITNCAVVLVVGARLFGSASSSTVVFNTKSAC